MIPQAVASCSTSHNHGPSEHAARPQPLAAAGGCHRAPPDAAAGRCGMDHGVGDQLTGQQDGPVDQGAVGEGPAPSSGRPAGQRRGPQPGRSGRGQQQLVTQVGWPGEHGIHGFLDAGVQLQEVGSPEAVQDLGDWGVGATQRKAGGWPGGRPGPMADCAVTGCWMLGPGCWSTWAPSSAATIRRAATRPASRPRRSRCCSPSSGPATWPP